MSRSAYLNTVHIGAEGVALVRAAQHTKLSFMSTQRHVSTLDKHSIGGESSPMLTLEDNKRISRAAGRRPPANERAWRWVPPTSCLGPHRMNLYRPQICGGGGDAPMDISVESALHSVSCAS